MENNESNDNNLKDVIEINNVQVYLDKPRNIKTFEEIVELSKKEKGSVKHTKPKLYSIFKSLKDGSLETYVSTGDIVKYKNKVHVPAGSNIESTYKVNKIDLWAIGSMTIITAHLNNGDECLANYLIKQ